MYIIAIDIGGTQTRVAVVNEEGEILQRKAILTNASDGVDKVMNRLIHLIHELYDPIVEKEGKQAIAGIGLAVPGTLNIHKGIIHSSPNLPDLRDVNIKQLLQTEFHLPVYMNNDANVAALGEFYFGKGRGINHFIYVTISTGVGAGIIENGRLLLGKDGQAAEVGHMCINPDGPLCNCGNNGCIEAYISGTAIVRRTIDLLKKSNEPSSLRELSTISTKDIFAASKNNDKLALQIIEETRKYLGVAIVNLLHLFNPQMIVFGGGVSQVGDYLFKEAITYAKTNAMYPMGEEISYYVTDLGDNIGLLGAAALVKYGYGKV